LFLLSTGAALAAPVNKDGVLGYYNQNTGAFRPLPKAGVISPDAAPATGSIVVSFTITLASTNLTPTTPINCEVDSSVLLANGADGYIDDSASVPATVTGTTAKCTVKIPYAWAGAKTSDSVSLDYAITAGTGAGTSGSRYLSAPLATFNVPANGSTKTFSVAATL
jgi:hypothetical protein